jgi:hypothetical protein
MSSLDIIPLHLIIVSFLSLLLQGMPLPFPFMDNYADLESVALLVLEPAKKSTAREKDRVREGLKEREWERGSEINVNFLQSVLQNPLSALSEFNWRGERMMEQLEKHNVRY